MISPMPITVEWTMKRRRAPKQKPTAQVVADQERIPRLSRLMALAIKFDGLIGQGVMHDYADLARLGHVSRARITQIMNLLNLALDIQEEILRFEGANKQTEALPERNARALNSIVDWQAQRELWRNLNEKSGEIIYR
jgi:hypothetical protein